MNKSIIVAHNVRKYCVCTSHGYYTAGTCLDLHVDTRYIYRSNKNYLQKKNGRLQILAIYNRQRN